MLATLSRWFTPRQPDPAPLPAAQPEPSPAPLHQGYLDERSTHHVRGWLRDGNDPAALVPYEVILAGDVGERILARGTADQPGEMLDRIGVGAHGFLALFDPPLDPPSATASWSAPPAATPWNTPRRSPPAVRRPSRSASSAT